MLINPITDYSPTRQHSDSERVCDICFDTSPVQRRAMPSLATTTISRANSTGKNTRNSPLAKSSVKTVGEQSARNNPHGIKSFYGGVVSWRGRSGRFGPAPGRLPKRRQARADICFDGPAVSL